MQHKCMGKELSSDDYAFQRKGISGVVAMS